MSLITLIKPQKSKKRVNIYLDGKFGFGIDLENFVKLGLKVEQELSDKEVEEIVKNAEFQKTLEKLLRFTALRPRSEKEIKGWLYRKRVHESLQKDLFDRLQKLKLVDDREFARWWVAQRQEFKPRGERFMIQELRMKGIKKETIDEVMGEIKMDEEKVARELLEQKKYRWKSLDKHEARQKAYQFLAGKGFGWEIIKKVVKI